MNVIQEIINNPLIILDNLNKLEFSATDYVTLTLNILLFFFVKKIVVKTDTHGKAIQDYTLKVKIIRGVSALFLVIFGLSCLIGQHIGAVWSQTYSVVIVIYLINHWINNFLLVKYGDEIEVDDVKRFTDNYVSQILRIAISVTSFVFAFFILIQVWGLGSLLESGSAFVTIGFLIFATKEFWLLELLSSLAIHAKGTLKRGNIIELEDGICYVILESRFMGTRLRELKTKIETTVPNRTLIQEKVKIHSMIKDSNSNDKKEYQPIKHSIEFNIGYDTSYEAVKEYFETVMQESKKKCGSLGSYDLNLLNNGDHAVTWEFIYHITNPFHMKMARDAINLNAFRLQKDFGIDLSTPITYVKKS